MGIKYQISTHLVEYLKLKEYYCIEGPFSTSYFHPTREYLLNAFYHDTKDSVKTYRFYKKTKDKGYVEKLLMYPNESIGDLIHQMENIIKSDLNFENFYDKQENI